MPLRRRQEHEPNSPCTCVQVRTDRFAEISGAGCAFALAFVPCAGSVLIRVAGGSVLGMGLGIVAHVATRPSDLIVEPFNESRPNPHVAVIEQYTNLS